MVMTDEEYLAHYLTVAPILTDLLPNDFCVAVTDKEKYLLAKPSAKINLNITPGTPLKPGTSVAKAVAENRRFVVRGDKALFGVPYIAYAYPIRNGRGEAIGAISVAEPVDKQERLKEMADKLSDSISNLAGTAEEISAQTQQIADISGTVAQTASESSARVRETDEVLQVIKDITAETNLLGLNAAIEAARVGEQGRGFGVVAEEIRKLAATSGNSVKRIEGIIRTVQADSEDNYRQMSEIKEVITQVAGAITHVAKEAEELGELAGELDQMAVSLVAAKD